MKNHALILLEGETEEEFYKRIGNDYLKGRQKSFKNMRGNFNINRKILDKILEFSHQHPDKKFDVYICIDQEKVGTPPYNKNFVLSRTAPIENCQEIFDAIINLMIESVFFIDIKGIFVYLGTPKNDRKEGKYKNFRTLTDKDLSILFKKHKKIYKKGKRCGPFINSLDIEKIRKNAAEISNFIQNIQTRS
jgi:hypothetical protein